MNKTMQIGDWTVEFHPLSEYEKAGGDYLVGMESSVSPLDCVCVLKLNHSGLSRPSLSPVLDFFGDKFLAQADTPQVSCWLLLDGNVSHIPNEYILHCMDYSVGAVQRSVERGVTKLDLDWIVQNLELDPCQDIWPQLETLAASGEDGRWRVQSAFSCALL